MSRRPINVYTPLSHSTTIFILWRFLTPSGNFVITPASHGRHFEAIIRDHFHKRVHPYIELPPHIWFIFTLICSTAVQLWPVTRALVPVEAVACCLEVEARRTLCSTYFL